MNKLFVFCVSLVIIGCGRVPKVPIPAMPPAPTALADDPVGNIILTDIIVGSYIIYVSIAILAMLIVGSFFIPILRAYIKWAVLGIISGMMLRSIGWVQINYPAYVAIYTGACFAPFAIMMLIESYRQARHKEGAKIMANVVASPQPDMELIVNDDKAMKAYQKYKDKNK